MRTIQPSLRDRRRLQPIGTAMRSRLTISNMLDKRSIVQKAA
jgi:hypothetical protein